MKKGKKRTREQGIALARAYRCSGLKLRDFAKTNGVTECSVRYWCGHLRGTGIVPTEVGDAQFVEVKAVDMHRNVGVVKVTVGAAEVSFVSLPEASWMSEFVVSVNRFL